MASTKDPAATTSTHVLTVVVFVAMEIAMSQSMCPMINPPRPATTVALTCASLRN